MKDTEARIFSRLGRVEYGRDVESLTLSGDIYYYVFHFRTAILVHNLDLIDNIILRLGDRIETIRTAECTYISLPSDRGDICRIQIDP